MSIKSLEMTSKMLAVIMKNPGISWSEIISELSIPQYDKRAKPFLMDSQENLEGSEFIVKSGEGKSRTFTIQNQEGLASGNLLLKVYNDIELTVFSESTGLFDIAKSIIIHIYESGSNGIDSAELKEKFPEISDEQYSSALDLVFELKSVNVKEDGDSYFFDGNPMSLITLVNNELNILTGDIDELEESSVKKVKFASLSPEDKNDVVVLILENVPKTKKSKISRNFIARKYSRTPEVKYLGRQILINLVDVMKEQGLIATVESKSGKRDFLYLTEEGKNKLKELKA